MYLIHARGVTSLKSVQRVPADCFLPLLWTLQIVLAAIGIYGVMAYSVAQRTQEIGIRMVVAFFATYIPARRASQIDPTIVLR